MTGRLRVALVQEASTLDPSHNRAWLSDLTPPDTDLVVFPEAFQRDFGDPGSDLAPYAETTDGAFGAAVASVAAERSTTIVAGMFEVGPVDVSPVDVSPVDVSPVDVSPVDVNPDPAPFNTLLVRGAAETSYRKIHLYDSFGYRESDRLSAGLWEPVTFGLGGFTIGLMTCYDLRFPELGRALVDAGADVLVAPSAWVAGDHKVDHWRTLVRARAIENTVYVVAVGQPAPRYCGHSMIVGPLGEVMAEAGPDADIVRGVLDAAVIAEARRTNPSLANRRR